MTLTYDLYWSFRSPYSYLVTPRLIALERDYDVHCNVRVVYPLAVRTPEFFDRNDPLWQQYFMRDVFRSAEFVGLPLAAARPGLPRHGDGEISEGTAAHPPADAAWRGGDGARQRPPLPR